jgi:membrane associated rhomboid family serine protease
VGRRVRPNTLSGQYWRLLSPAFVHIGILHIFLNMWCLWSLGRLLERLVGPFTTLGIYLLTAVGASLLSLSWDPMRVGAGASGAIFGITGTLIPVLYYGNLNFPAESVRKLLGYVVRFSLINLLYGLRGHVNNMAHLGGLITGLLAGVFLARSFSLPSEERGAQRRTVLTVAALAMVALFIPVARAKSYAVEMHKGLLALDHNNFNSAIHHLQKYAAAQPNDAYGHAVLGSALQGAKRYDESAREYEQSLQLIPRYPFVQVNLGKVYFALDRPDKAVQMFRAGISGIDPDADIYYWYAAALKATGDLDEAEKAVRQAIHLDAKGMEAQFLLNEILEAKTSTDGAEIDGKHTGLKRKNARAQPFVSQ